MALTFFWSKEERLATLIRRILRVANIVSIHIPATQDKIHIIGEKQLVMTQEKGFAVLINSARDDWVADGARPSTLTTGDRDLIYCLFINLLQVLKLTSPSKIGPGRVRESWWA